IQESRSAQVPPSGRCERSRRPERSGTQTKELAAQSKRGKNFMTNFEKAATSFLLVIAVGVIGGVIWLYQMKWQQPLGPALQLATVTPFEVSRTWTLTPKAAQLSTPWPTPVASTLSAAAAPTGIVGRCGTPPVITILAIG